MHTNGTRTKDVSDLSVPTDESLAWDTTSKDNEVSESVDNAKPAETWGATVTDAASTAAAAAAKITSSVIPDGAKKSWASMFKPAPVPTPTPKKEPSPTQKYIFSLLKRISY